LLDQKEACTLFPTNLVGTINPTIPVDIHRA
jgi:hypothetical protein